MSDLRELKQQFLEYLEIEKGRSNKTIENYDHYISRFIKWSQLKDAKDITEEAVRGFRIFLNRYEDAHGAQLKKITQSYYIIALRGFLKYLARKGFVSLAAEKVEIAKVSRKEVEFLDASEVERILDCANGADLKSLRDKALLELLFSAGLRVSELTSLNRDRLDLKKQEFAVRGKGDKIRVVFVSNTAKIALENYLNKRHDIDPALFVRDLTSIKKVETPRRGVSTAAENGLRLTPRSVQRIVKYYAAKAGIIKDVHPHTFRHSFATDLLINGADIRSVQAMLGHSSITTTQIYTHITDQQLGEVHKAFHARRRRK